MRRQKGRIFTQLTTTRIFNVFLLILTLLTKESDANGNPIDSGETFRFPVWFTPSPVSRIHGLAIMPISSGYIYDKPQAVNGLALHGIGMGIVLPLVPYQYHDQYKEVYDSENFDRGLGKVPGGMVYRVMDRDRDEFVDSVAASHLSSIPSLLSVNGGLFSLTGTFSYRMNGISVSLHSTAHGILNGISACPIYNRTFQLNGVTIGAINDSFHVRGIQIGIFNSTYYLNGIQLGIINRNRKRTSPFINWSMDK